MIVGPPANGRSPPSRVILDGLQRSQFPNHQRRKLLDCVMIRRAMAGGDETNHIIRIPNRLGRIRGESSPRADFSSSFPRLRVATREE